MDYSTKNPVELRICVIKKIMVLHRMFMDIMMELYENDHLSKTETIILFLLREKDYKATDLAKEIGIPSSTLTGVIDRLVDRKYVDRSRSKEDRRVINLCLSEEFQQKKKKHIYASMEKLMEETEKDLTNEWWIQMRDELEKMEKVLDRGLEQKK